MKKILIVSPSESFRKRNTHLLNRSDFQIISAATGEEASQLHHTNPFDIIVSELLLDDMGGDELCTLLRKSPGKNNFSFILVCHDIRAEIDCANKSTADTYITKPVQPVQLLKAIGDLASAKLLRNERVPLRVRVKTKRGGIGIFCVSHDVSVTGILIETEEMLELNEQISCYFSLPGFGSIETKGEVLRYARIADAGYKYGVQFSGLTQEDYHKIDQYVASFSHDESQPE